MGGVLADKQETIHLLIPSFTHLTNTPGKSSLMLLLEASGMAEITHWHGRVGHKAAQLLEYSAFLPPYKVVLNILYKPQSILTEPGKKVT